MSGLSSHARAVAPCKGTSQYSIVHHCITLVYFGSIRSHLVNSVHFCPIQSISVQFGPIRSNSVLFSLFQSTSVDLVYFSPLQLILDLLDLKLIFFVSCLFSFWLNSLFFFFSLIFGLKSMKFFLFEPLLSFWLKTFSLFFFLNGPFGWRGEGGGVEESRVM